MYKKMIVKVKLCVSRASPLKIGIALVVFMKIDDLIIVFLLRHLCFDCRSDVSDTALQHLKHKCIKRQTIVRSSIFMAKLRVLQSLLHIHVEHLYVELHTDDDMIMYYFIHDSTLQLFYFTS